MKYQDFVIKNGKFVGKFDEMYRTFNDPWDLIKNNKKNQNLNYKIIFHYCEHIQNQKRNKKINTLEIGCGYPQISNDLSKSGFNSYGTDVSNFVIEKSKKKYPKLNKKLYVSNFLNFKLYEKINPDIIILSDITWYILPELKIFLNWFKRLKKKTYLIHSLAVYGKKNQKYGKEYFFDLNTILKYFKLNFISSGQISHPNNDNHTFFLADNKM